MQQLTNCYYILNFCSNCRYRCATFGQQFVFDNGSFYDDFSVECRADQTWSAATIPHQCACEYFLQHQLKQDLSLSQGQSVSTHQSLMQRGRWLSPGTPTILRLTTRRLPTSAMLDNLTTGLSLATGSCERFCGTLQAQLVLNSLF